VAYLRPGAPLDKRKFWVARFARIYPLFFVTLVLDTPSLLLPRIAKYGIQMGILKTTVTFVANTVGRRSGLQR
jgi:peptidoglycan/LPS O-acetylase OafA/YrhL